MFELPSWHAVMRRSDGRAHPQTAARQRRGAAKQALHMAQSLAKVQPNRGRIALTLFRDKVHDLKGR
jgi:hypothetical protein